MTCLAALALALVAGCGGKSSRLVEGGDDGSGTGGTAGRAECRAYAARYTLVGVEWTCDFDRAALTLRCDTGGAATTTSWATLGRALSHDRPIGRITFDAQTHEGGSCDFTNRMEYDAEGRPLVQTATAAPETNCGNDGATYSEWDAFQRPLAAVGNGVGAITCDGQTQRFEYDDRAKTMVVTTFGGTGTGCHDYEFAWSYDDDALPLHMAYSIDGIARGARDYVTLETSRICPD